MNSKTWHTNGVEAAVMKCKDIPVTSRASEFCSTLGFLEACRAGGWLSSLVGLSYAVVSDARWLEAVGRVWPKGFAKAGAQFFQKSCGSFGDLWTVGAKGYALTNEHGT